MQFLKKTTEPSPCLPTDEDGYTEADRALIESDNLEKYETPIAKQLGEPTRSNYSEGIACVEMNGPLHFITVKKQFSPSLYPLQLFETVFIHHNSVPLSKTELKSTK